MGFLRSEEKQEASAAVAERDANPEQRWEYKARNLQKVVGVMLEGDFNKLGQQGWEFVAMVGDKNGYAIFKRRVV